MMRLKIAFRNLMRNQRRTFLNVLMIAGGFAAIVIFQGFAENLLNNLRGVAINNQFGHFQVAKNNYWDINPDDSIIDRMVTNPPEINKAISKDPNINYAAGRIEFFGLVSSGDRTVSARFIGFDPAVEKKMANSLTIVDGENFNLSEDYNKTFLVGKGLADYIGVRTGDDLTILTYTHDGVINAADLKLKGKFLTTVAEVDNTTAYLPLDVAQKLLDTNSVDKMIVILNDGSKLDQSVALAKTNVDSSIAVKPWQELATMAMQVEDFFKVQNNVIGLIIIALVLLSISNTIGMSIFERIGEIGTLRAIGNTSKDIVRDFVTEGFILGLAGSFLGILLSYALSNFINLFEIPMVIPNASVPINIRIIWITKSYFLSSVISIITASLATYISASRISKINIVDALRYNI